MSFIPRKINVRGADWAVKVENEPKVDDQVVAGYCDRGNNVLAIAKECEGVDRLEVFIHEYLHAAMAESGIHDEGFPLWMEHQIINAIAKDMKNNISLWSKVFSSFDVQLD